MASQSANYTEHAQQVFALARKEAERVGNNYVGAEHLLLGMLSLGQCGGVKMLQRLLLDVEQVRAKMESETAPGRGSELHGFPYTPRSRHILTLAAEESNRLRPDNSPVGTEHILLGIVREADSLAARALQEIGIDLDLARNNIVHDPEA